MNTNYGIRTWRSAALLAATACGLCNLTPTASAQTSEQGNATDKTHQPDVVVVTASRREESIKETPVAVSAYGGEQLGEEHIKSLPDLVTQSPNIQLGSNDQNTNIAIRGIGTNLQTAGNDPGVAFQVDGIYIADPALARLAFFDVNRVEVLRGPQGTLFGRNATGGAVNVISNAPTADPQFGLDVSAGIPAGGNVEMFASGPLNGDASLIGRAALQKTYQEGSVENTAPSGPDRLNDKDSLAGRVQLAWSPIDDFSIRLMGDYQKSDTAGPAPYLVGTPSSAGLPPQLSSANFGAPDDSEVAVTHGAVDLMTRGVGLFLDWGIAGGSLNATLSRRRTEIFTYTDGDGTDFEFNSAIVDQSRDTTYAEVLYSSDDNQPFSFILGANYVDDSQFQDLRVPIYFSPVPVMLTGDVKSESFAVFGHAQYRITDALRVFGGVRYSKDSKRLAETNNFIGALTQSDDWSKPTFEIGASYDFDDNVTGYLKHATGYKSGGYSSGSLAPPFNPETNKMWELGLKGSYFDGSLDANLALFHMAYDDLQVNQIIGVSAVVTNAARATISGAELELDQYITPDLRITVDAGWLNAKFDRFLTTDSARPALGVQDLQGNRLPQAPEFMFGIGPVYTRSFADGGGLTLAVRYDWKSRVYFNEFNLPLVSQDPTGRFNAYLTYDLPDGKWQVGLFGRNLTDERTFSSMLVYSALLDSIVVGTLEPSREYGVRLSYRN